MGVYSVISHATSKLIKVDTTNSRTLTRLIHRLLKIAKDLEKNKDKAQRRKLEKIVEDIVEQYAEADKGRPSSGPSQIAPILQEKRRIALVQADAAMDEIESPPDGHSEAMQRAISKDQAVLKSVVESLSNEDVGVLEQVCALTMDESPMIRESTLATPEGHLEQQGSNEVTTTAPLRSQDAYTRLEEKLAIFQQRNRKPPMVVEVPRMGAETTDSANTYLIPLDSTVWTLTDTITNSNGQFFLPDIWSRAKDGTQNRATESQLYFERQDPNEKIMDIINKDGYLGIESVFKEGEYVVALVKTGDKENGFPINIPRCRRQPASLHLKEVFPNYRVSQVRRLQLGDDASHIVFDNRSFRHQTNPIFVELCAEANLFHGAGKGKGRALDSYPYYQAEV